MNAKNIYYWQDAGTTTTTNVVLTDAANQCVKVYEDTNADGTPDFESTMVIAPDAQQSQKKPEKKAANSTDAFIDRLDARGQGLLARELFGRTDHPDEALVDA